MTAAVTSGLMSATYYRSLRCSTEDRARSPSTYETLTRLYVLPGLGSKRLDKLTLRDVRSWLNKLRDTCQCCAQGKDARRAEKQRRCCAKVPATCCRRLASERTIRDAWTILCSALTNAVTEELVPKNVASWLMSPNRVRGR